ncbi:pilus specific protein [Agrilactobacillus composti DSM 18527 = JCM 14202]|uniref:Pilus specific protein n=1 Tax=Agrilactobacillus composti DSM 18527 = JCM 14202 TaxID=1423734 RepID=A0A0R1Y0D8_9LACO|nr:pilus specific protein [Agrilactobacillus composti DSM 18527 = JCM 14202]
MLVCLVGGLATWLPANTAQAADTQDILLHKRIFRDLDVSEDYQFQNTGQAITDTQSDFMQTTFGLNKATFVVFDVTEKYDELANDGLSYDKMVATYFNKLHLARKDLRALVDRTDPRHDTVKNDAKYAFLLDKNGQVKTVFQGVTKSGNFNGSDGQQYSEDGLLAFDLPKTVTIDGVSRPAKYMICEIDVGLTDNIDYERLARYMVLTFPVIDPDTGLNFKDTLHLYPKNIGYARDPYFLKVGKNTLEAPDSDAIPLQGAKFVLWQEIDGEKQYLDMSYESALQNKWIPQSQLQGSPLEDQRVTVFTSQKNGLVTMEGRLLASGTYYFEEMASIPGYVIHANAQKVKVEVPRSWEEPVLVNGQPLKEPEPENPEIGDEFVPLVYNLKENPDVVGKKFQKVAVNNHDQKLSGAQFVIENPDGKYLQQKAGQNNWVTVADDVKALQKADLTVLTSDAAGNFAVKDLEAGTYRLREIKAPDGYQLNENPVTFIADSSSYAGTPQKVVNAKKSLLDLISGGGSGTSSTNGPGATKTASGKDSPKLGGFLPQTGNAMLNGLILVGILLIAWAVYRKVKTAKR